MIRRADLELLYLFDIIDEEEFYILSLVPKDDKPRRVFTESFDLDKFDDDQCKLLFRFKKEELVRLLRVLGIPEQLRDSKNTKFSGMEGLCLLLRRLAYPNRLCDLESLFHHDKSTISRIFKRMLDFIFDSHSHLLKDLNQQWLSKDNLLKFSDAIYAAGSPLRRVWGFIDGTARAICRPKKNQKPYFSGHKRKHCVKYQSIMCPNGMIARMDGPYVGKRHDSAILYLSKLTQDIESSPNMHLPNGTSFMLFGDPGYTNSKYLISPYKLAKPGTKQAKFNAAMSKLRVSVEWGFGKVLQEFAFCDFKKNQKLRLQPVGRIYLVSALLTNCHTCINGSNTGRHFNLPPPTLEEYFNV